MNKARRLIMKYLNKLAWIVVVLLIFLCAQIGERLDAWDRRCRRRGEK
jgi:hypothetical protein